MRIKDTKPTFKFIGDIKEIRDVLKKDGTLCGHDIILHDNSLQSEVALKIWSGSDAKYWDIAERKMVSVTSNIPETMAKVKANGTGAPLSITVVGKTSQEIYTNDEFIALVKKLPKNTRVQVDGIISFRTYNNRVQKDFTIRKLQLLNKTTPTKFMVNIPCVIHKSTVDDFKMLEHRHPVNVLVKAKLENGAGYGYRPTKVVFDKTTFFGGMAKDKPVEGMNQIISQFVLAGVDKNEYTSISLDCLLKIGEITRKPTVEDLNPVRVAMYKMLGNEKGIEDELKAMPVMTTYSDEFILDSPATVEGIFNEPISASELNLLSNETTSIGENQNIFADAMNSFLKDETKEEPKIIEAEPEVKVEEKVEEVKEENNVSKLEDLVASAEANNLTVKKDEEDLNDVFPF